MNLNIYGKSAKEIADLDAAHYGIIELKCNSDADIRRIIEGYVHKTQKKATKFSTTDSPKSYNTMYPVNMYEANPLGMVQKFGEPFKWTAHGYNEKNSCAYESSNSLLTFLSNCIDDANRLNRVLLYIPDFSVIAPKNEESSSQGEHNAISNTYILLLKSIVRFKRQGKTNALIIIGCKDGVPAKQLKGDSYVLDIPCPEQDDIKKVIDDSINKNSVINTGITESERTSLAEIMSGLREDDIRSIFDMAFAKEKNPSYRDLTKAANNAKKQLIEGVAGLKWENREVIELYGIDDLEKWIKRKKGIYRYPDSAREMSVDTPKGLLLCGLPGTGKTTLACNVAHNLGDIPMLKFDISALKNKWVGETEANCEIALKTIESVAPCVVLIDEIEKVLSAVDGGGAHETTMNMFSKILDWMQKKRKKPVFLIATANKTESLPPELKRKGRFDETFFVGITTKEECKRIFRIHLKRKKDVIKDVIKWEDKSADDTNDTINKALDKVLQKAAKLQRFLNGSDIESLVSAAFTRLFSDYIEKLTKENKKDNKKRLDIIPKKKHSVDEIEQALLAELEETRSYFDSNMNTTAVYWLNMFRQRFRSASSKSQGILPYDELCFDDTTMKFDFSNKGNLLSDKSKTRPDTKTDKNDKDDPYTDWLRLQLKAAKEQNDYDAIFRWKLAEEIYKLR